MQITNLMTKPNPVLMCSPSNAFERFACVIGTLLKAKEAQLTVPSKPSLHALCVVNVDCVTADSTVQADARLGYIHFVRGNA